MSPPTKAQFTMSEGGFKFPCEECGCYKFVKVHKFKVRCANEDCGVVYNVEFGMLDIDVLYYEA